jgi:hypothetical protein
MRLTTSKRALFKNHLLSNLAAAPPPEIILGFVGVSTHLGNHPEQRFLAVDQTHNYQFRCPRCGHVITDFWRQPPEKRDMSTFFAVKCLKATGGCGVTATLPGSCGWPIRADRQGAARAETPTPRSTRRGRRIVRKRDITAYSHHDFSTSALKQHP